MERERGRLTGLEVIFGVPTGQAWRESSWQIWTFESKSVIQ